MSEQNGRRRKLRDIARRVRELRWEFVRVIEESRDDPLAPYAGACTLDAFESLTSRLASLTSREEE